MKLRKYKKGGFDMKRTLAVFLCAVLLLTAFAGCVQPLDGPGMERTTEGAATTAPQSPEPQTTAAPESEPEATGNIPWPGNPA